MRQFLRSRRIRLGLRGICSSLPFRVSEHKCRNPLGIDQFDGLRMVSGFSPPCSIVSMRRPVRRYAGLEGVYRAISASLNACLCATYRTPARRAVDRPHHTSPRAPRGSAMFHDQPAGHRDLIDTPLIPRHELRLPLIGGATRNMGSKHFSKILTSWTQSSC
jgi:hypothetical protein